MTPANNHWEDFFDGHALQYMENVFTRNTIAEVDFIMDIFNPAEGQSILDVGCGTGRHSVELARRGYKVVGIDLSSGMLVQARKAAEAAGVEVEFIKADATEYRPETQFDFAVCLCEGAFCLLGTGDDPIEHDLKILSNIRDSLKPGGMFILTCLSAFRTIRMYSNDDVASGRFDPLTLTEKSDVDESLNLRERGYVPTELRLLFDSAGLEVLHIWGGTAGNWGRRAIDLDEYEIMVVARKPA